MAQRRFRARRPLPGPDPGESTDPQIRGLVDRLAGLQLAPEPDTRFRTELRTQLVAVAPRLIEESREPARSRQRQA